MTLYSEYFLVYGKIANGFKCKKIKICKIKLQLSIYAISSTSNKFTLEMPLSKAILIFQVYTRFDEISLRKQVQSHQEQY